MNLIISGVAAIFLAAFSYACVSHVGPWFPIDYWRAWASLVTGVGSVAMGVVFLATILTDG